MHFFTYLIFLYFSLIFLAAIWAFLPGCSSAIVSKIFIVSSLSLISSLFASVSTTAGGGLWEGFFLAKFLYFLTIFLATSCFALLDFFKSIMSPIGSVGLLLLLLLSLLLLLLLLLTLFFGALKIYRMASWSLVSRYPAAFNQLADALFVYLIDLFVFYVLVFYIFLLLF